MSIVVNKTRLPVTQWQTESGSVVSISDARKRYAKSLSVALEPIQDLHGYANPWVGGAGKNLLKTAGLTEGAPSDTTFSNATKRTFTVGTFVPKLTNNNYYQGGVNIQSSVSENSIKVTSSARAYSISIPIVGLTIGEKYVLSCTKTNAGNNTASFYKQDGTFISNTPSLIICTFTVPEETYYTLLHFDPSQNNVEATFTDIQLEKGSVPSSYAPYANVCPISGTSSVTAYRAGVNQSDNPQSVTVQLGQTVYGGSVDLVSGVMSLNRAMVVYDGSNDETWNISPAWGKTNTAVFYSTEISGAYYPDWTAYRGTMTNLFLNATRNYIYNNDVECCGFSGTAVRSPSPTIRVLKTRANDVASFRSFLNSNNLQFCYELATPITIQLSPNQIEMLMRNNTVWSDAGVVTLNYARIRQ